MRTRILFATSSLVLAVSAVCSNPTFAQAAAPEPATTTLHVSVNLVVVPVTVRDTKEHIVPNLTKEDFTLEVDGKPQTIRYFDRADDTPLTVGLLVDVSGSMRKLLDEERTASSAFLDGMLKPGRDQAFVVQFGHSADLLSDITQSVPKLQAALQKLDGDDGQRPSFNNGGGSNNGNNFQYGGGGQGSGRHGGGGASSGGTVLYDAVYLSSDEVLKKAPVAKGAENSGQARKALILLTDGDDRGSKESLPESIEAAQRTDTAIYAIYYKGEEHGGGGGFPGGGGHGGHGGGFPGGGGRGGGGGYPGGGRGGGGGESHVDGKKILQRMADETGGRVYEVTKKMPLADIYKQIAEELRGQYRLGFSPANTEAGYHKLVVDTPKQKKVILQARDGYYTGDAK